MRSRSGEKEQFWRLVMDEHEQSGLSAREFCRRESLSEASFYSWRRKLRDRDVQSPNPSSGDLVPVKIVNNLPGDDAREKGARCNNVIEVIAEGRVVLRVSDSCHVDTIVRLLDAVRRLEGGVTC